MAAPARRRRPRRPASASSPSSHGRRAADPKYNRLSTDARGSRAHPPRPGPDDEHDAVACAVAVALRPVSAQGRLLSAQLQPDHPRRCAARGPPDRVEAEGRDASRAEAARAREELLRHCRSVEIVDISAATGRRRWPRAATSVVTSRPLTVSLFDSAEMHAAPSATVARTARHRPLRQHQSGRLSRGRRRAATLMTHHGAESLMIRRRIRTKRTCCASVLRHRVADAAPLRAPDLPPLRRSTW